MMIGSLARIEEWPCVAAHVQACKRMDDKKHVHSECVCRRFVWTCLSSLWEKLDAKFSMLPHMVNAMRVERGRNL